MFAYLSKKVSTFSHLNFITTDHHAKQHTSECDWLELRKRLHCLWRRSRLAQGVEARIRQRIGWRQPEHELELTRSLWLNLGDSVERQLPKADYL